MSLLVPTIGPVGLDQIRKQKIGGEICAKVLKNILADLKKILHGYIDVRREKMPSFVKHIWGAQSLAPDSH